MQQLSLRYQFHRQRLKLGLFLLARLQLFMSYSICVNLFAFRQFQMVVPFVKMHLDILPFLFGAQSIINKLIINDLLLCYLTFG